MGAIFQVMTAEDAALLALAEAFQVELTNWLAAQEVSDPLDTGRLGESVKDRVDRLKRVSSGQAYAVHSADFKNSYGERFTPRALAIYAAFEKRGLKPSQSREKYEFGWMTLIVESIIEDVGRLCAALRSEA